jgi:large subunit ribosomal protein L9
MKVLLCKDVEKLGFLGDVLDVSTGYARNYLLPQGLAVIPSETNIKALAKEKAKRAEERIRQRKRLEEIAAKVQGAEAVIASKANEQGHLFGSVAEGDIAANLREQGFEVADEVVQLSEHIKEVGTYNVILKFASDLTAAVNAVVVALKDEAGESTDQNKEG